MDLSEESNNNNSAEDDDQPKLEKPSNKKRTYRSRSRDDPRSSKASESRSRHRRDRSEDRNRKEDDKERSRKYDSRSKHDKESSSDDRHERKSSRDERNGKSRDEKRRRRSSSRDRKRSTSKERKRSSSKDRKRSNSRERNRRSGSKDKRRSGSKERRRSRSPRRDDRRRRSSSKERDNRVANSRYGKRFDRTSSKIAQLEKLGIEIKTPDAEFVTPQMLLQRSMDEQVQKVKNSTGIELPKYYNPAAMNPARYADQIQKRRLLWQKKEAPATEVKPPTMGKVWEQTTFAQDSDGKVASKFKRLMGIKDNAGPSSKDGKDILKKQEEMFSSMEQQYEVARTATHTMRGVGLGFGTFNNYPR